MTNLAVVEKSNEVQIAPNLANDFGQVIALKMLELASDPSFDVEKLEKLAELQAKEAHRQDEKEFSRDFANMQAEIPLVIEDKAGNGSKYATLEKIVATTRQTLQKYGFSTSFETDTTLANDVKQVGDAVIMTGYVKVKAILRHKTGITTSTELLVPFDFSGSKKHNSAQAMGSAVSYGKRYTLASLLNIATADDDAVQSTSSQAVITKAQADSLVNSYDDLSETGKAEFDGMMKGGSISNINAIPANFYNWAFSEITKIKNKELASNANS